MRIQHNIPAMSSYRNYTNNASALAKNLERLSSGYKINRAGDDAAGLAISEKMRAQITGLEVAQKNSKDGISLVQTAEGALTEVHDMLNRMYELAGQSANGTYDNEVDRYQLQKEIDSLRDEINRIADSSNFNGINLLDGTMQKGGTSKVALGELLKGSMIDGINPSAAGAAEFTVTLGKAATDTGMKLDVQSTTDGLKPSDANPAKITLTVPVNGSGTVSFLGTPLDQNSQISALGNISVGGSTIKDLFNIVDASGNIQTSDNTNGGTDWTSSSTLSGTVILQAKTPGGLSAAVETALTGAASTDVKVVLGNNVGEDGAPTQVEYDITLDTMNIAGGQTIELGGKKILVVSEDASQTTAAGYDAVLNITGLKRDDTSDTSGTTNEGAGKIAENFVNVLDTLFGSSGANKFTVTAYDQTGHQTTKTQYKVHLTGTAGADSIIGNDYTIDGNTKNTGLLTITTTQAFVAGSVGQAGQYASATYGGFDVSKLTVGSKIVLGGTGTMADDGTGVSGGTTIEIVDKASDQDAATGKLYLGDCTTDAAKARKIENFIAQQSSYTLNRVTIDETNKTITVKDSALNATPGSTFATTDANSVNVWYKGDAKVEAGFGGSTTTGGTTTRTNKIETGVTTVEDLGKMMVNGMKLSDMFTITVKDASGGAVGSGTIGTGYSVHFKAKVNGKLSDTVMNEMTFTSTSTDVTCSSTPGYDEGTGGAATKTQYKLDIDFAMASNSLNAAGGQSFTFGNEAGKTFTFDLSFDNKGTENGTTDDGDIDATNPELAGGSRVVIDLSRFNPTTQAADMAEEVRSKVEAKMGALGFDVKITNNGSNKYTLELNAKVATNDTNLGDVRYSSQNGALSNPHYQQAIKSTGGDMGTYAQVAYEFDLSKLAVGDTITAGGKTITIAKDKGEVVVENGAVKSVSISLQDAKDGAKLAKAFETAGYRGGQLEFADGKVTITDTQTGRKAVDFAADTAATISVTASADRAPKGLRLQIGDTADSYNQLEVSINDCHAAAMVYTDEDGNKTSIADIDISSQDGASSAMKVIKNAINYVSDVRGTLGATQNRLDHTINNLSVMQENIQDAESTIRDTDIAEEMMAYTKNNILVQSAQAMLAQANQLPQGVLQLLQ